MNDKIDKHNSKGISSPPCKGGAGGGSAVRMVLREAIRQEELSRPPMPKDLNARLMKRVEKEVNNKPAKKSLRLIWPWIAAACVAAIIAVNFTPPKQDVTDSGKTEVAKVEKEPAKNQLQETKPDDTQPLIAKAEPEKPQKQEAQTPATVISTPPVTKANVEEYKPQVTEPIEESVEQEPLLAAAEKPQQKQKPRVLTERDIPITRPENYRHTEEEIALMRRQANEAYLKWVELELEIANHYYEQTAEK